MSHSKMMYKVALLSILALLLVVSVHAGTFTDDLGTVHNFEGKPTVAVRAGVGGRSLYHFGMGSDQLKAVYGRWTVDGSTLDVEDTEGSVSNFPDIDPNSDEIAFLAGLINLTPECFNTPGAPCTSSNIDYEILGDAGVEYMIYIDSGRDAGNIAPQAEEVNVKTVFIDATFENTGCRTNYQAGDDCYYRSSIDIVTRIHQLAIALGVDIPASVEADRQAMCEASTSFTNKMRDVQDKGVRVMAGIISVNPSPQIRLESPNRFWTLRTFEELGMPIMHPPSLSTLTLSEYFPGCSPVTEECTPVYPIDFWLVDTKTFASTRGRSYEEIFPDKATKQGQIWYFPNYDGALSYRSITNSLNTVAGKLESASPLHDAETTCTPADPTSQSHRASLNALGAGEYACYDEAAIEDAYTECADVPAGPTTVAGGDKSATSATMAVSTLLVGLILSSAW